MRLVTVATHTFPAQAHLTKALLESEGIFCRIANEHMVNADGFSSVAVGGVQVQVPEDAVEAALEVLANVEPEEEQIEGDPSRLVPIASFGNPLDAHAVATALDDAGIAHRIVGEGAFGMGGSVSVVVAEAAVDEALRALRSR